MVLSRGNTLDYAEMYRAWAGHDPSIQPYLVYYGLTGATATPAAESVPPAPAPAAQPQPQKGERGE
jgi:peptidyl-dipeptidase Dcp